MKASYSFVTIIFIVVAIILINNINVNVLNSRPEKDDFYFLGNSYFDSKNYKLAENNYLQAIKSNGNHLAARRGYINSLILMKKFDSALKQINIVIDMEPGFGGNFATRGIIFDHLGQYEKAITDYQKALTLIPEIGNGISLFDRFRYNVTKNQSNISSRLKYLKKQLELPKDKRILKIPVLDKNQASYKF